MNNKDLLKAIGEVDESYIEMAGERRDNKAPNTDVSKAENTALQLKTRKGGRAWRWAGGIAAALAVCVCIGIVAGPFGIRMGGMAKSAQSADSAAPREMNSVSGGYFDRDSVAETEAAVQDFGYKLKAEETTARDTGIAAAESEYDPIKNAKLIYRADLYVQTTDYAKSLQELKTLVGNMGGYFESTSENNGGINAEAYYKSGWFSIRIPSEKYKTFLDAVGGSCHIVNINESVEDIGQQYYDTEARLETLKIKQERLQNLLRQATNMADIISIEDALSETEYQIENYTSTLNRYDGLVNYSTVSIQLEQVSRYDGSALVKENFWARMARVFKNGLNRFGENVQDFALWISYNAIGIVITIIVVFVLFKFRLISRLIRKIRG